MEHDKQTEGQGITGEANPLMVTWKCRFESPDRCERESHLDLGPDSVCPFVAWIRDQSPTHAPTPEHFGFEDWD